MIFASRLSPPLLAAVSSPSGAPIDARYFWFTGALSSFLDNAPTYLVLFNLAGGDPVALMGPMATTLAAISAGAVFMGAMTYIGNAPNFMVKSIAESRWCEYAELSGFYGLVGGYSVAGLCRTYPAFLPLVFAGSRQTSAGRIRPRTSPKPTR